MRPARQRHDLATAFGARVKQLRTEAGLTQEALAWDCDISKGYLSRVEAGSAAASLDTAIRLATRLGVELFELFLLTPLGTRGSLAEDLRVAKGPHGQSVGNQLAQPLESKETVAQEDPMDLQVQADGTLQLPADVESALGPRHLVYEVSGHTVTLRPEPDMRDPRLAAVLASLDGVAATEQDLADAIAQVRAARRQPR